MINGDFLAKLAGFWFWERWHPEVALRYLPIVEEIKRTGNEVSVLEVGSGGLGIAPYLGREVTGVDVDFQPPYHPLLRKVKARAERLPFNNSSFDIVISTDVLEHIPIKKREKVISEMLRVAKNKLIIGVPCGKLSFQQDLYLDKLYRDIHKKRYPFLEEQLSFGLPEKEEIRDTIYDVAKKEGKKIKLVAVGNENLKLRMFLMQGFISKNLFVNIFYRKILFFFIPVMSRLNSYPTYRQIFFIDIRHENSN